MATFKAEVQPHQKRRDGKYPVSIRVTNNRRSFRIPTGLYVAENQINKRSFEIKDQFVIERTNKTIRDFESRLLTISTAELLSISNDELKSLLTASNGRIDYLDYCNALVAAEPIKMAKVRQLVNIIGEMGYKHLYVTEVNSRFVMRLKEYIDKKTWVEKDGTIRTYTPKTKNGYLKAVTKVFNLMCAEYNTDYVKTISHTISIEYYDEPKTKSRALDVETIRRFINMETKTGTQRIAHDMCVISLGMCGINIRDLLSITKNEIDMNDHRIMFCRKKTGVFSSFRIPDRTWELLCKYMVDGDRILKFGNFVYDDNYSADVRLSKIFISISSSLGIDKISPYWFRHSWATIARNELRIDKSTVDMCISHSSSFKMTDIYVKEDWRMCDEAAQEVEDFIYENKVPPRLTTK